MKNKIASIMLLLIMLVVQACNLPAPADQEPEATPTVDIALVATIAASTLQAIAEQKTANAPLNTPTAEQAETAAASPTAGATITPTYALPMVLFTDTTNCRTGPAKTFPLVYQYTKGQSAEILGKNEDGKYWVVKVNSKDSCWVAAEFVTTAGSAHLAIEMTSPPTKNALNPSAPTNLRYDYVCDVGGGATITLTWSDNADGEQGYRIYRNGEKVAEIAADAGNYRDVTSTRGAFAYKVAAFNGEFEAATPLTVNVTCQ